MANYQKINLTTIEYATKLKTSQIQITKESIDALKDEVERLKLEATWCYDSKGKRIVPTAEEQAKDISQQLSEHPHLIEDTVKALRQKKIEIQSDLDKLQKLTEELDPFL